MRWTDAARAVGAVAPAVGMVLGGPGAAAVGELAASVLGVEAKPEAIVAALRDDPAAAGKLAALEVTLADRKDARLMYREQDSGGKRFLHLFVGAWTLFAMVFIAGVVFLGVSEESSRFADSVLGFLLGTVVATTIQFFLGSSDKDGKP